MIEKIKKKFKEIKCNWQYNRLDSDMQKVMRFLKVDPISLKEKGEI